MVRQFAFRADGSLIFAQPIDNRSPLRSSQRGPLLPHHSCRQSTCQRYSGLLLKRLTGRHARIDRLVVTGSATLFKQQFSSGFLRTVECNSEAGKDYQTDWV